MAMVPVVVFGCRLDTSLSPSERMRAGRQTRSLRSNGSGTLQAGHHHAHAMVTDSQIRAAYTGRPRIKDICNP